MPATYLRMGFRLIVHSTTWCAKRSTSGDIVTGTDVPTEWNRPPRLHARAHEQRVVNRRAIISIPSQRGCRPLQTRLETSGTGNQGYRSGYFGRSMCLWYTRVNQKQKTTSGKRFDTATKNETDETPHSRMDPRMQML